MGTLCHHSGMVDIAGQRDTTTFPALPADNQKATLLATEKADASSLSHSRAKLSENFGGVRCHVLEQEAFVVAVEHILVTLGDVQRLPEIGAVALCLREAGKKVKQLLLLRHLSI